MTTEMKTTASALEAETAERSEAENGQNHLDKLSDERWQASPELDEFIVQNETTTLLVYENEKGDVVIRERQTGVYCPGDNFFIIARNNALQVALAIMEAGGVEPLPGERDCHRDDDLLSRAAIRLQEESANG